MNDGSTSATNETLKEPTFNGEKKSQVVSRLPVLTQRQPLKSQQVSDQGLKIQQQVSLPAESSMQLKSSNDKENRHGQTTKSEKMQHRYIGVISLSVLSS